MKHPSNKDCWLQALQNLSTKLNQTVIRTYFSEIKFEQILGDTVYIVTAKETVFDYFNKFLKKQIEMELSSIAKRDMKVEIKLMSKNLTQNSNTLEESQPNLSETLIQYEWNRFDNFYADGLFSTVKQKAQKIAEDAGKIYNPVIISGGYGSGKTHLAAAIRTELKNSDKPALFISCNDFVSRFICAINSRSTSTLLDAYLLYDAIIIEDFHTIPLKPGIMRGFTTVIEAFIGLRKLVLLTCFSGFSYAEKLNPALVHKLDTATLIHLPHPNKQFRKIYFEKKFNELNFSISKEILETLSDIPLKNTAILEGIVKQIITEHTTGKEQLTNTWVMQIANRFSLGQQLSLEDPHPASVLKAVEHVTGINIEQLKSTTRRHEVSKVRNQTSYILHKLLGLKASEVGRILGGKSHHTVISGSEKTVTEINSNNRQLINQIDKILSHSKENT